MVYIPVLAAAIAVIGILFTFKKNVDSLKQQPELVEKYQRNLFLGSAISESIPLILIIFGFTQMDSVTTIDELYVPFVIVFGLILFSIIYILLQTRIDVDDHSKGVVLTFGLISLMLSIAVPIIAIGMLFMMVP